MVICKSGVKVGTKAFKDLLTMTHFCQMHVISLGLQKPQNNNPNWGITFEGISLNATIQMKVIVTTNKIIFINSPELGL